MAPETNHTANRSAAEGGGTGVPLMTLVLAGALRVRRDGEDLTDPPGDAD
ncbi:MAG: hypothetical protein AB7V62_10640 [Thermoleophilia bacterium]